MLLHFLQYLKARTLTFRVKFQHRPLERCRYFYNLEDTQSTLFLKKVSRNSDKRIQKLLLQLVQCSWF
jgi:hypothetical protein